MSSASTPRPRSSGQAAPLGLTTPGLVLVLAVPTVVAALLNVAVWDGLGWFFNVVFAVVTVLGALRIRLADRFAAVIVPPLVYAGTIIVVTPLLGGSSGLILSIGANLGEFLAVGAPWLIGSTAIALVIVLVRGRHRP